MICIKSFFLETSDMKDHFDDTQTLVFVCVSSWCVKSIVFQSQIFKQRCL